MAEPEHDLYATYLTSHLAGASSGVNAFVAATRTWRGTAQGAVLRDLVREISTDRDDLRALIDRLGYGPGPARKVLLRIAELAGRANPVNLLRRRFTASTQLELEELISAVRAKHSLWQTLAEVAAVDDRLDAGWLRDRADQAATQEERLIAIMLSTAPDRFSRS